MTHLIAFELFQIEWFAFEVWIFSLQRFLHLSVHQVSSNWHVRRYTKNEFELCWRVNNREECIQLLRVQSWTFEVLYFPLCNWLWLHFSIYSRVFASWEFSDHIGVVFLQFSGTFLQILMFSLSFQNFCFNRLNRHFFFITMISKKNFLP